MDRKQNLFRLMESYMNDFRGDAVQEMYGNFREQRIPDHLLACIVDSWVDLDDVGHIG